VIGVVEDQAGQPDGVGDAAHSSDRAQPEGTPVHDDCVHLDVAGAVEDAAHARVEGGIVFHDHHRSLDRIQRRSARRQDRQAGLGGGACPGNVIGVRLLGDLPGPAMNDDAWDHGHSLS